MKTYYNILGIPESAHAADIKRAYRQMAKQHHPDVSKSDKAHERFIMIEKAYATLSDPTKRKYYDNGLNYLRNRRKDSGSRHYRPSNHAQHADPRTRRSSEEIKQKAWITHLAKLNEDKAYYQKFVVYKQIVSILGLVFATLFIIDDLSSTLGETEFITNVEFLYPITENYSDADYYLVSTSENEYRLHQRFAGDLENGQLMRMEETPILHMRPSIWIGELNQPLEKQINPVYALSKTTFYLLFLLSMAGILNQKRSELMVNLALISGLIFALCALFMWLKLLP